MVSSFLFLRVIQWVDETNLAGMRWHPITQMGELL